MTNEQYHQAPNIYIGEVHLKVQKLDRAIQFYENIIGLQVLSRSERSASLTADGKTPLVTLEQPEDVVRKAGRHSGLYHFALLLPTRADLSVFLRHLIETGYPFGAADHYVSEALYINDLDGNGIEIYWDRPASEWTWKNGLVDMATEELDGQGVLAESNEPWSKLASGTIMGHIHLHVGNVKEAERFYDQTLGFKTAAYYPQAAFMSTGGYHHHIAINTWQGAGVQPAPDNMVGLIKYAVVFPDSVMRAAAIERLEQASVSVSQQPNVDEYETSDPAGNRIRLIVRGLCNAHLISDGRA